MKKYITVLLFLICLRVIGQDISIPNNFIEISIPKTYSNDWHQLNYSSTGYFLKRDKEKLIINKEEKGNRCDVEIEGGKLIGIDDGEWGGGLYFRTKNLQEKLLVVKSGNIVDIFKFKNEIYFIQGLAHMGISDGALFKLIRNDNNFSYEKIADFDDAPFAITTFNNKFFIVSYKNFYVLDISTGSLIKMFDDQFWDGLYPSSIVAFDEKNIFVGMRAGIMKINSVEKTIKFYKTTK